MGSATPFDRAIANFKCGLSQERLRSTPAEDLALAQTKAPKWSYLLSAVYVVANSSNSLLKVGYADHLKTRVSGLNTGSPVELRLIHFVYFVDGVIAKRVEGEAHKLLAEHRRRGEWFEVTPEQAGEAIAIAAITNGLRWWSEAERRRLMTFIEQGYVNRAERARIFGT